VPPPAIDHNSAATAEMCLNLSRVVSSNYVLLSKEVAFPVFFQQLFDLV
jgi:hypothetical protein